MEELAQVTLPYPDRDAKNLFVRDDKRRNYYLITVRGDKRVNLKEFRRRQGTKPLTFASPEELQAILGLIPGAVTPFGLLNDEECRVHFYIDRDFWQGSGLIGGAPQRQHRHRLAAGGGPGGAAAGARHHVGHRGTG